MSFKTVSHVIFDMDGTILETESIYQRILNEIAQQYGKEYTPDVQLKILGTPEQDTAKIFIRELNIPLSINEFLEKYHKRMEEELKNPQYMPGAVRLIKHLANHKIPIAIATSASKFSYDIKTKHHQDIFQLFHHVVCGSSDAEVKHGKPAPDIFLVCASRFPDNPDPSQVLVLEDAPNGIRGASSAGMQSIIIPEKEIDNGIKNIATLVLKSLEDIRPELFGLPPFES
ncbi:pseudouridine-5'-phosphatase-like [Rhynchophorus ferrugineus]|uniref:pseudouridine 5'-phosphatase n=1 Tax=Rhynchophorus ferrugineus TaxID=354439 RepID=A0A834IFU8_RHYFE|nr:hypothetical protein GWI33_014051 [Rhynchophorus ferrugineus]